MNKSDLTKFIATRFDGVIVSGNAVATRIRREFIGVSPQQIRIAIESLSRMNPGSFGGSLRYETIAGVNCGIVNYNKSDDNGEKILWIHGGAFAFGSAKVYKAAAIYLAKTIGCEIVIPEYRLSPENVYPAAIDDIFSVYKDLIGSDGYIPVIGDSAGGNIATCLVQRCISEGVAVPSKLALMSPWIDLSKNSISNQRNQNDFSPFDQLDTVAFSRDYIGDVDDENPLVSPLYGSFAGFPETHVQASKAEFLSTDSKELIKALSKANVKLDIHWESKAMHGWQLLPDFLPEAKRSLKAVANFLNN